MGRQARIKRHRKELVELVQQGITMGEAERRYRAFKAGREVAPHQEDGYRGVDRSVSHEGGTGEPNHFSVGTTYHSHDGESWFEGSLPTEADAKTMSVVTGVDADTGTVTVEDHQLDRSKS